MRTTAGTQRSLRVVGAFMPGYSVDVIEQLRDSCLVRHGLAEPVIRGGLPTA